MILNNDSSSNMISLTKIAMLILTLGPILMWYKIQFPVSLGSALILFLSVFFMIRSRFNFRVLPWTFIPLFVYISGLWCINNSFALWTLLPPGGWVFFIFVLGLFSGVYLFDMKLCKKYMKWTIWIAILLFWVQFVLLKTTGSQQFCFVPPLTPEFTYENMSYADLASQHVSSSYPCSIFLEKSYMAYYLVAYLCLTWFRGDNKNKMVSKEIAIIVLTLIFLKSGSGIVGLAILFAVKAFSIFWTHNIGRRVVMIILVIPLIIGIFYAYQSTDPGQEIFSRQEELFTEGTSGYTRVVAGYLIYDMLTPQEQMIGKPDASEVFGKERDDGTINFYINGVQTILINLGYIGALLYLLFYGSIFRRVSLSSKMCIIVLLAMALLESNYLNSLMLLLSIIPCADYFSIKKSKLTI